MGKQRVKFTFEEILVKQPVIYELGHKFKIVTNIRRAEVGEDLGVTAEAARRLVKRAVNSVRENAPAAFDAA